MFHVLPLGVCLQEKKNTVNMWEVMQWPIYALSHWADAGLLKYTNNLPLYVENLPCLRANFIKVHNEDIINCINDSPSRNRFPTSVFLLCLIIPRSVLIDPDSLP